MRGTPTVEDDDRAERAPARATPGVVVVFAGGRPLAAPLPLDGGALEIGRDTLAAVIDDERMSRRHARVAFAGGGFTVADLGSRNGTFLDGARLAGEQACAAPRVVRCGHTLLLLVRDVAPFEARPLAEVDGAVVGATLGPAWEQVAQAARAGEPLLLAGESGTGKELAARHYHASGRGRGPFVAVNCATIPAGVAERLLFGTRRGAYSGADVEADGYLQAADGGTLFLDEIGELEPAVQAKLLRALEAREVLPLGAQRPRPVDVRVCAATLRDLRAEVAAGRFRDDLYYRLARFVVALPPLRARAEETAWLAAREAAAAGVACHYSLVEACLLRRWPGNVRELATEVRRAAERARAAGRPTVEAEHLAPTAGLAAGAPPPDAPPPPSLDEQRAAVAAALAREGGNVSRAARALGMHRNQLRRWLARHGKPE